jgi:hypothetical protein
VGRVGTSIIFLAGKLWFNQASPCPVHMLRLLISLSFAQMTGTWRAAHGTGRTADSSPGHPGRKVTCNICNLPDVDGHQKNRPAVARGERATAMHLPGSSAP